MEKETNKTIEWSALEYEARERGNDWFWALGIIVLAGSVAAFIYGNVFFGLFIILGGVLIFMFSVKKPDLVYYELGSRGLKIKNRLFPYENIKSFWIGPARDGADGRAGTALLFIRTGRVFMPVIYMPLSAELVGVVRSTFLARGVVEEEMKEHFSDKVMNWFGF